MRTFAIVPAAGRSVRMGRPKLLLPWDGATVLEATLSAWRASRVDHLLVVVHPNDADVARLARRAGAEVVVPFEPPAEMKASIALGLADIEARFAPTDGDAWLVAPADMPALSPEVIDRLLDEHAAQPGAICIPTHQGKHGHPVLFPWPLAALMPAIPPQEGLKWLLRHQGAIHLECGSAALAADLDTPDDYDRQRGADH